MSIDDPLVRICLGLIIGASMVGWRASRLSFQAIFLIVLVVMVWVEVMYRAIFNFP